MRFQVFLATLLLVGAAGCTQYSPVTFDKQKLAGVNDHARAIDQGPYRDLINHACCVSDRALEKAGTSVAYGELMNRPEKYRGEPISIEGVLWRLYALHDPEFIPLESEKTTSPFEAWIVDDEGQPYRVVLMKLPTDLKPGDKSRRCKVTGYFFMIEDCVCSAPEEFGLDTGLRVVSVPTLLAQRIVSTSSGRGDAEFDVRFSRDDPFEADSWLPDIQVGLRTDIKGKFTQLTLGDRNLGRDDAAFRRLNREILTIIGRPGNPLTKEIAAVIDADENCTQADVARAVAACAGHIDDQAGH